MAGPEPEEPTPEDLKTAAANEASPTKTNQNDNNL